MSLRVEAGFEHIREAMAEVLSRDIELPVGTFITVLSAKVTANTGHAKFILSVFPEGMKDAVLTILKEREADIKQGLSERARLRRIPRLHYGFDETEAVAEGIERTLFELKQKGEL
ncbi:MAG: ribosome-binding factor A [Candidatus Magasanikbacteria bacterium]|nr:ribosome-binding factor A [Candidatus Magasanikbacteria bacterium]MCA9389287.1 ribosome-binding factor A [Candidatus Magasanikbacteria bacterium]MCA9390808.1 ribosome-binding factor A [Candidatus Magasanikbacteria bacterium]USN52488.1 MAG: ribosome-binding factor A [Candidatus Nomurabacteria bacterium]HPF95703.1 ribosome-binding factor A [bacterium]